MSGADYTLTPNLGLYKPNYALDVGQWGNHLNANADVLDGAAGASQNRDIAVIHATDPEYGVVPNATDNTAALQAFFAALQAFPNPVRGVLPAGWLNFTAPLTISGKQWWTLEGAGIGATGLVYRGADMTVDLLKITNCFNFSLAGFAIDSNTVMTAGTALHLENSGHACLTEIRVAGQSGATHIGSDSNMHYNLWNGFWFDKVDQVTLFNFEAAAQNDAARVNGSVGPGFKAGLFVGFGKIMSAHIGLHVGGGFGGVYVDNTDIIGNWNNVVVDQALANEFNREVMIGVHVSCDSSGLVGTPTAPGPVNPGGGAIGDNILLKDVGGGFIFIKGWVVSTANGGHCIHIVNWAGVIRIDGAQVSYAQNVCDGIRIDTPTPQVIVTPGTSIHDNTGYGINQTVAMNPVLGAPTFTNAHLGDISPTTKVQFNVKNVAVSFAANMTAAGTTQATATLVTTTSTLVGTVAAGSGVILPVTPLGTKLEVMNSNATALNVYPPVGWSFYGSATNAPRVLAQNYRLAVISGQPGSQYLLEYAGPMIVP